MRHQWYWTVLCTGMLWWNTAGQADNQSDSTAAQQLQREEQMADVEEKEAMEIGGVVTVDAAADPNTIRSAAMEVGTVELSANVNVADGIIASITLLAEGNLSAISIDEALVEWAPQERPLSLIFGQQTFNHGLLSTHLISDPLLLDVVETAGAGLTLNFALGSFTPGIAVAFRRQDEETKKVYTINFIDSTIMSEDVIITKEKNIFTGVVNVDVAFFEESMARLSLKVYGEVLDLDFGTGLVFGPAAIDLEVFGEIVDDDNAKTAGYTVGMAYGISDNVEAALRYEGFSQDQFNEIVHRIGLGGTIGFKYGIFCAVEYAYNGLGDDDGSHEIALQLGLESTLKLPGFHRKTLTRNQALQGN